MIRIHSEAKWIILSDIKIKIEAFWYCRAIITKTLVVHFSVFLKNYTWKGLVAFNHINIKGIN